MRPTEIFALAISLSMDAFAVSISKGLAMQRPSWAKALLVGAWFGGFQALMPTLGFIGGSLFSSVIAAWDHWVAFAVLGGLGMKMAYDAFKGEEKGADSGTGAIQMLALAIGTSIDALAAGVSLAFLGAPILFAAGLIGITTFGLCVGGVHAGKFLGSRMGRAAGFVGGVMLIGIGTSTLLSHLGVF